MLISIASFITDLKMTVEESKRHSFLSLVFYHQILSEKTSHKHFPFDAIQLTLVSKDNLLELKTELIYFRPI